MSAGNPERMNVFDPNTHIQTIVIVGCGGTGAQVARIVARIVYDMRRARLHTPGILLVDPDIVEEKNVGRQLFTPADAALKLPKVEVVGRRLNMALGLDIAWSVEPFDAEKHGSRYGSQLVIGCVDNHLARRELHKAQGILIGAGNYRDGGQVVIGNVATRNRCGGTSTAETANTHICRRKGCCFPRCLNLKRPHLRRRPICLAPSWCCAVSRMFW